MRVFGELHRHRDDLVLLQDLDDALRPPRAVSDEQHRVAALTRLTDVDDPVMDATPKFHRGETTHVSQGVCVERLPFEHQLFETRRRRQARGKIFPADERELGMHTGSCSDTRIRTDCVALRNSSTDTLVVRTTASEGPLLGSVETAATS